jgi:small subunit ribosomal protein S1
MSDALQQETVAEAPAAVPTETVPTETVTEIVETPVAEAPVAQAAVAETPLVEAPVAASPVEAVSETSQPAPEPAPAAPTYDVDVLYPELVAAKNNKTAIDVTGLRRVRGGILAAYKDMPLFLPTSHLSLKSNPSENELLGLIKKTFPVHVHELDEKDKSKVIISRRRMLRNDMLSEFKVGQIVEGKVASVTDFGAFINLGGVDGMVHVSAMSRRRVGHPSEVVQKGDTVKAVVTEINPNTQRLALSMKDLEADPWTGAAQEFAPGTKHTGKIKSITDFGVYVELKPGVEGLVHISEMSWARRIKHPSELFQTGQEITVQVLEISEEKHKVALGYKQTQPNPWENIAQRFSVGQVITGTVKEVLQKGVVISVAEDIDAFMPRGKMHPSARAKNAPFEVGQVLDNVLVMDVEAANHSLIIGMEGFDQGARPEREGRSERGEGRGERAPRQKREDAPAIETSSPVTLADMLSEDEKRKLFGE